MADHIFTFWEGKLPAYIQLCMQTWKFPYTLITYDNLREYTSFDVSQVKRFSLPQISDCIRVHVLRDNGGYWLDTDTIMLGNALPDADFIGNPKTRSPYICFLHAKANSDMYKKWAEYQDNVVAYPNSSSGWDIMGNAFIDKYAQSHDEVSFLDISSKTHPEYIIAGNNSNKYKYRKFYFEDTYTIEDIPTTEMLLLHNSWTPAWYKELNSEEVLNHNCTLSNILRGLL